MNIKTIGEELAQIKADLAAVLDQECDDAESYDLVKLKASVLKVRIHTLKDKIGSVVAEDKESKMAYQKLYNSLQHIESRVHYKIPLSATPDDVLHQIELIKAVKDEIENL